MSGMVAVAAVVVVIAGTDGVSICEGCNDKGDEWWQWSLSCCYC